MSSTKFGYNLDGLIVCQLCKANALMNLKTVYKRLLIILNHNNDNINKTLVKPLQNVEVNSNVCTFLEHKTIIILSFHFTDVHTHKKQL